MATRERGRLFAKNDWRADVVAAIGEFLGTFTCLLFGLGGIQAAASANTGADSVVPFLLMASTSMGLALIFAAWIFYRITGACFNPNIALMLFLLGVISPLRFALFAAAQLIGAICASAVLLGILPGPLAVNTFPNNGTGTAQALFYEMFLTFGLCMTVIMLSVEKNKTTPLGPVAIGLALFSTQLAGIFFTGAAVNTARAFGPAVVTSFDGTHWIYWVGPSLGAILAAGLYKGMHAVHYWELTPGVDATSHAQAAVAEKGPRSANTGSGAPTTANRAQMHVM